MKKLITLAAMFAASCLFAQDNAQQSSPQNAGTAVAVQQTPGDDGSIGVIEIVEVSATDTCGCSQCDFCKGKFCRCDSTPQCAKCCKAKNCPDNPCPKTVKCK